MIGRGEKLEKQVGIPVKDRSIFIPVIIIVINSPGAISSLIKNCINKTVLAVERDFYW